MHSQSQNISDEHLLFILSKNTLIAWGHLYDKYAPMMYGIIHKLTPDKRMCEEIFTEVFFELKEKKILSTVDHALWLCLYRHTYNFTIQELMQRKITPNEHTPFEESQVLTLLCSEHYTLCEVAYILHISEEEVKKKLRHEFLALRNNSLNGNEQ